MAWLSYSLMDEPFGAVSFLLLVGVGACVIKYLVSWHRNYRLAQQMDVPIVLAPWSIFFVPWIVLWQTVPAVLPLLRRLPFGLGEWAHYSTFGWQYRDNCAVHQKLGPIFALCAPDMLEVFVADPDTVHNMLLRRKAFVKPKGAYTPLQSFGPNVIGQNGKVWERHRRITAPTLNERVSASVWHVALEQARDMLAEWEACGTAGTRELQDDAATVTLHILMAVALGKPAPFKQVEKVALEAPHEMSFEQSLHTALRNWIYVAFLPMKYMDLAGRCHRGMRKLATGCREFQMYQREIVQQEAQKLVKPEAAPNLLNTMVQALEEGRSDSKAPSSLSLSEDEVYGNLFGYTLAGHETTANVIVAATFFLCTRPDVQEWVAEEIRRVVPADSNSKEWNYEQSYPKLKRCLSLMVSLSY